MIGTVRQFRRFLMQRFAGQAHGAWRGNYAPFATSGTTTPSFLPGTTTAPIAFGQLATLTVEQVVEPEQHRRIGPLDVADGERFIGLGATNG